MGIWPCVATRRLNLMPDTTNDFPFDVIAVLGAALSVDGSPTPSLIRRVDHGIRLLKCGCAPRLLMVGGYGPPRTPRPTMTEAAAMVALAIERGVSDDALFQEDQSTRTLENAVCTAALMQTYGWQRVLVVTDVYHLPRALLCFKWAGVRCWGNGPWHWRPGQFLRWFAGWPREAVALCVYGWMMMTGKARQIANSIERAGA